MAVHATGGAVRDQLQGRRLVLLVAAMTVGAALLPAPSGRAAPALPITPLDGTPLCGKEAPPVGAKATADDKALRVATFNVLHSETDDGDVSLGDRLPL